MVASQPQGGDPVYAPSWGLLKPVLDARRAGRGQTEGEWRGYASAYLREMAMSYDRERPSLEALLSRPRVVLTCYCTDAERCHRKLLGLVLSRLGAIYHGELPDEEAGQRASFDLAMTLGSGIPGGTGIEVDILHVPDILTLECPTVGPWEQGRVDRIRGCHKVLRTCGLVDEPSNPLHIQEGLRHRSRDEIEEGEVPSAHGKDTTPHEHRAGTAPVPIPPGEYPLPRHLPERPVQVPWMQGGGVGPGPVGAPPPMGPRTPNTPG